MRRADMVADLSRAGHAGDVMSNVIVDLGIAVIMSSEFGQIHITPSLCYANFSDEKYISVHWFKWALVYRLK